jgi:hypothetical protein
MTVRGNAGPRYRISHISWWYEGLFVAKELELGHAHARPDRNRGEGVPENMPMVRPRACDLSVSQRLRIPKQWCQRASASAKFRDHKIPRSCDLVARMFQRE